MIDLLSGKILDLVEYGCISYEEAIARAIADDNKHKFCDAALLTPLPFLPDTQV